MKKELQIYSGADCLIIKPKIKNVEFQISCDGTGFVVEVPKERLKEFVC